MGKTVNFHCLKTRYRWKTQYKILIIWGKLTLLSIRYLIAKDFLDIVENSKRQAQNIWAQVYYVCFKNPKFYINIYLCHVHVSITSHSTFSIIFYTWRPYFFLHILAYYIHINNSWNICARSFKFPTLLHFFFRHVHVNNLFWFFFCMSWLFWFFLHLVCFCLTFVPYALFHFHNEFPFFCLGLTGNAFLVLSEVKRPQWWAHQNVRQLIFGRSSDISTPPQ